MYYQEKYENGILYSRSSPNDMWIPISHNQLSKRVVESEAKNKLLTEALEKIATFTWADAEVIQVAKQALKQTK